MSGPAAKAAYRGRPGALVGALARRLIPVEFQPPPVGAHAAPGRAHRLLPPAHRVAAHGDRIPDAALYQPLYSPWLGDPDFERVYAAAAGRTLVSRDRCYVLWRTLQQALALDGELLECGVFRGGTALLEATTVRERGGERPLHLVDSFAGMPRTTDGVDRFQEGDFGTTSAERRAARARPFPFARVHQGYIPADPRGARRSSGVAWAYIDVDIYARGAGLPRVSSTRAWLPGGTIVLDDYGFPSCPGVRRAMDEFFADGRPEVPLCLPTGQGLVDQAAIAARRSAATPAAASACAALGRQAADRPVARARPRCVLVVGALYFWTAATSLDPGRSYHSLLAEAFEHGQTSLPDRARAGAARARRSRTTRSQNAPVPAARRDPLRGPVLPLLRAGAGGAPLPASAGRRRRPHRPMGGAAPRPRRLRLSRRAPAVPHRPLPAPHPDRVAPGRRRRARPRQRRAFMLRRPGGLRDRHRGGPASS